MVPQPRVGASVQAGMWEDLRNKPSSAEQRRDQYSVRVNIPDARGNRYERWQLCVFLPKNGICSLCIYPTPYVGTSCVLHANNKSTSRNPASACCPSRRAPSHLKKLFLSSNMYILLLSSLDEQTFQRTSSLPLSGGDRQRWKRSGRRVNEMPR